MYYMFVMVLLIVAVSADQKMNVLFLVSDDMRPQINAYSGKDFPTPLHPKMHTPNLDALASRSLLLKRAYVQQAVCGPSRASLLTGRRPDTTRVYDLVSYWRKVGGNYTTIPQYFKENGYRTIGMGKVFHPGEASNNDDPISWTDNYYHASSKYWGKYNNLTHLMVNPETTKKYPLQDQQIAQNAIKTLQEVAQDGKTGKQPFFVAVGFHRPHLPWVVPQEYYDLYPLDQIKLPANPFAPSGMPEIAWSNFDELRVYDDILGKYGYGGINTTLPDNVILGLRRAYYAAISYTDGLVGQVIKELDSLGLSNNTIISFWGDHGWQIGEHGEWCKHTNFEIATHAPMMIHVPGLTDKGIVTEELSEFVDLYPTLVEAAGLPKLPLCPEDDPTKVETCTEGSSLVPLMKNPGVKWKPAVFSQYPRMAPDGDHYMGYTMRTDQYRYTEWPVWHSGPVFTPGFYHIYRKGMELYDHYTDPEENINRAFDPKYSDIRKQLSKQLRKGWRHALPPMLS